MKCLKSEVIPVSIRLKTNIKTSKGLQIIRRAEKQLLNECIRSINNTLELLMMKWDTYIEELKDTIKDKDQGEDQKTFEECRTLIKRVIECWHNKVMHRQKQKFENLQQKKSGCSNEGQHLSTDNMTMDTMKSVINLSSTPLQQNKRGYCPMGLSLSSSQEDLQLESM